MNPFAGKDWFEREVFDGLSLERADLGNREFYRCTFRNSKLQETRWARSRLEECVFEACDLTRADPTMLSLRDVAFRSCKLMGIDFSNIGQHPHVSFEDCNLRYVSVVSVGLRKTSFKRCAINEANFFESDLADAEFDDCHFAETRFDACDLRRARFRSARDLFIDPARNRVKGTQIPLETAILLATSFGMRVLGFTAPTGDDTRS
jgi:uncharacterized protein YjbI with pentapeptide repeats